MRRGFVERLAIFGLVGGVFGGAGCASGGGNAQAVAEPGQETELDRIRAAVTEALGARPPRGYAAVPDGVRLLSVARDDEGTIVLNFSSELLTGGSARVLEDALRQILAAASAARDPGIERADNYKVLVNGITLDAYLP